MKVVLEKNAVNCHQHCENDWSEESSFILDVVCRRVWLLKYYIHLVNVHADVFNTFSGVSHLNGFVEI